MTPPAHAPATTPPELAELADRAEAWNAHTQRLCADLPEQADVRRTLLALEKQAHTAGWDQPPQLFWLGRNDRGKLYHYPLRDWSHLLVTHPARDPDLLQTLAHTLEHVRAAADDRTDMMTGDHHDTFHGIGFLTEGWMVVHTTNLADRKYTNALGAERRLSAHPRRLEIRLLHYVARDGWYWDVTRVRHTPTVTVPRYVTLHTHDDDAYTAGTVTNALGRLCNAIASNPVAYRRTVGSRPRPAGPAR